MTSTISSLANAVTIVPSITNTLASSNAAGSTANVNGSGSGSGNTSSVISNMITSTINVEEKVYKKEKQILLEFDTKTKDLKSQLNEGTKCLEQRLDTQISILYELQDFFKKRAEVELQYSRDLDKLTKQIYARHKSEKAKRETWHLHSASKLWEALLNDTKQHSKYHQVAGEICSKYVADKFDDIIEDIKRIFAKCKGVGQSAHEEIFKVVGELHGAMKTYHEYQSESKQAEAKLKYVQSQKPKYEKQKSKKKLKQYEKQVEKRLQKYTETKVKAFKARNEYILSIDSANACINKFCNEDIGDLVDCTDFGFHASVAKCIYMYLSAQENIKRSRQLTVDNLSRSIGDLDSNADKTSYLDYFSFVFNIQKKFQFEPHKGDEVSQVNAQSLIRYEMEKRFEQLDNRLKTIKTENDEIFKTIEATEQSLLSYFDVKNCDMSDLFRDLNLTNQNAAINKQKRIEIEDYYVEKVRQYTTSSNLIARLSARHSMMQKALCGCVNNGDKLFDKLGELNTSDKTVAKKKIGKSPIIGQPRLFGGKLIEYINATKQEIPQIITSCIKAINRLGLHNQGIFRIPGSQLEINQFKEAFEKGEDPLITVNPREMNSVAGVLKLYLRELKDPLFPRDMYDTFIGSMRLSSASNTVDKNASNSISSPNLTTTPNQHQRSVNEDSFNFDSTNIASILSPVENIEAIKVENIRKTMANVPKPIYIVLRYLFSFLNHLSEFKDENMMDSYNIAICLAPTLIPVPEDKKDQVNHQTDTIELIKLIIQHNDQIFSMECEGPVYEKFDSELDNDEENLEESEDDEEEESERQINRNISDDETYATEAIALYDYKGRSDKELSFKKGSVLAIRGQLSTDWWQGSIISPSSNGSASQTPKTGYIPDKYIALRSCKRKKPSQLQNLNQMPSTPPPISSSSTSGSTNPNTPTFKLLSNHSTKPNQQFKNVIEASGNVELNKSNLSELSQVKESDILNDEDNESSAEMDGSLNDIDEFSSSRNNKFDSLIIRSPLPPPAPTTTTTTAKATVTNSSYLPYKTLSSSKPNAEQSTSSNNSKAQSFVFKKRISSSSSNSIGSDHSYLTLSAKQHQHLMNSKTSSSSSSSNNFRSNSINNTSLDDLLLNNKQQLKINHIEDALASVLDDMKQLDFSTCLTSSSIANNSTANNKNNSSNNENCIKSNLILNSVNKESNHSSTTPYNYKFNGIKTNGHLNTKMGNQNLHFFSKSLDDAAVDGRTSSSSSTTSSTTDGSSSTSTTSNVNKIITTTSALTRNFNNTTKNRPDLVIDLPLLSTQATSPPLSKGDALITTNQTVVKKQPITNCNSFPMVIEGTCIGQTYYSSPSSKSAHQIPEIKSRRLSVDQQKTSLLINANNQLNKVIKEQLQSSSTSSTESSSLSSSNSLTSSSMAHKQQGTRASSSSNSSKLLSAAAAAVAAVMDSGPNIVNNKNVENIDYTSLSPVASAQSSTHQPNLINNSNQYKHGHIVKLPMPHVPVMLMTNNLSDYLENSDGNCGEDGEDSEDLDYAHNLKIVEKDEVDKNELTIQTSNETNTKTSIDAKQDSSSNLLSQAKKKQPPPLMKKPEKSEEIMRKLGRSPPSISNDPQSNIIGSLSSTSSTSSTSTVSSLSTSNNSPVNSSLSTSNAKANLTMKLTNSKATDV